MGLGMKKGRNEGQRTVKFQRLEHLLYVSFRLDTTEVHKTFRLTSQTWVYTVNQTTTQLTFYVSIYLSASMK